MPVGAGEAGGSLVAVVHRLAGLGAGAVDAAEGMAVLDAGRPAGAETVAGPRRVEAVAGARRLEALGVPGVVGAAADAVAGPVVAAARRPLILADAARVGLAGVDRRAGAEPAGEVAGDAGALAGDVAADAVGAVARDAVAVAVAVRADADLAAAPRGEVARVLRVALAPLRGGAGLEAGARCSCRSVYGMQSICVTPALHDPGAVTGEGAHAPSRRCRCRPCRCCRGSSGRRRRRRRTRSSRSWTGSPSRSRRLCAAPTWPRRAQAGAPAIRSPCRSGIRSCRRCRSRPRRRSGCFRTRRRSRQASPRPSAGPFAPQVLTVDASPPSTVPTVGVGHHLHHVGPVLGPAVGVRGGAAAAATSGQRPRQEAVLLRSKERTSLKKLGHRPPLGRLQINTSES